MTKENTVITVRGLTKKFGDFVANDQLDFDVYKGEIFGFLGANGAGKTTAIKILCGLTSPSSGTIKVAGFDVVKETEKVKQHIGYMSQKFTLYEDMTLEENIRFYGGIYGLSRIQIRQKSQHILEKFGLHDERKQLIGAIPQGWKQKLAFSVAMLHDPEIVFLDEPTGGVDPVTRRQFWDLIFEEAEKGTTLFVTTHYMDESEYCDRVCIMDQGKIEALDTPEQLKLKYKAPNMDEVFLRIAREEKGSD